MPPKKNVYVLPAVPVNVGTYLTTAQFKIHPEDLKPVEKKTEKTELRRGVLVAQTAQDMAEIGTIIFISQYSFFNGLMLGDKLIKVNNETNVKNFEAEFLKGQECQCQLYRRKDAKMTTQAQMKELGLQYFPEHTVFSVVVQKPSSMTTNSAGLRLFVKARSAIVTRIEEKTICAPYLGIGDIIYGINGKALPLHVPEVEPFVRENVAVLSIGQKCEFLIVRAIGGRTGKAMAKWLHMLSSDNEDFEMAPDAIEIGREASNLHSIVLRKLTTPSILTADVKKNKNKTNKTTDASESSITISTASTEMKINSDVTEGDELKQVTSKSHAVSAQNMDVGAFDDE